MVIGGASLALVPLIRAVGGPAALVVGVALIAAGVYVVLRSRSRLFPGLMMRPVAAKSRTEKAEASAEGATASEIAGSVLSGLDARAERLERLLADADERIKDLERLERLRSRAPTIEPAPRPPEGSSSTQRIYDLADQGHGPVAIAREVNRPIGEVELILAVRGARTPRPAPDR